MQKTIYSLRWGQVTSMFRFRPRIGPWKAVYLAKTLWSKDTQNTSNYAMNQLEKAKDYQYAASPLRMQVRYTYH